MGAIKGDAIKAFEDASPAVNYEALNKALKAAGDTIGNIQGTAAEKLKDAEPWISGAIGKIVKAAGEGVGALGKKMSLHDIFKGRL